MVQTPRGSLVRSARLPPHHLEAILGSAVDTWATIFVAIGTVGAVAYALFRDVVMEPRRRPKLDLRFDETGNDLVVVATPGDPMQRTFCYEWRTERKRTPLTTSLSW